MVSPSPTEISVTGPLASGVLGLGRLGRSAGAGAGGVEVLPPPPAGAELDPLPLGLLPQSFSQGIPSLSPSSRVFPLWKERIASSQVRKLGQV